MSEDSFFCVIENLANHLKDKDLRKKLCEVIETKDFDVYDGNLISCMGFISALSSHLKNLLKNITDDYKLGLYYGNLTKDSEKMIGHYENCIKYGDLRGAARLGKYYESKFTECNNSGNEIDQEEMDEYKNKTINYYLMAEKYEELADFYAKHLNLPEKAIEYYEKSCTGTSYYELALIYKRELNYEKHVVYFEMAIEKKCYEAAYELGHYYNSIDNYKSNYLKYITIAADNNNECQFLAIKELMMHHFKRQEYSSSEKYANEGIKLSEQSNCEHIRKENLPKFLYMLGRIYFQTGEKNRSARYFSQAILYNHVKSHYYLGLVYLDLHANDEAIKMFELGREFGDSEAIYELALQYEHTNSKQFLIYLKESANLSNIKALEKLISGGLPEKYFENAKEYIIKLLKLNEIKIVLNNSSKKSDYFYTEIINIIIECEDSGEILPNDLLISIKQNNSSVLNKNLMYISDDLLSENKNIITQHVYHTYVKYNKKCEIGFISDFKIIALCDGKSYDYYLHTFVLNSDYFKTMIESTFANTKEITIEVSDLSIISSLIQYLYLNKLSIHIKFIDELISLSREYMFIELRKICTYLKYLDVSTLNDYFPAILTE